MQHPCLSKRLTVMTGHIDFQTSKIYVMLTLVFNSMQSGCHNCLERMSAFSLRLSIGSTLGHIQTDNGIWCLATLHSIIQCDGFCFNSISAQVPFLLPVPVLRVAASPSLSLMTGEHLFSEPVGGFANPGRPQFTYSASAVRISSES